ncbi:MAG: SRPBCC family protein [Lautropia sp.]|nr:SRPBCC family protein [Lautropia sp.]
MSATSNELTISRLIKAPRALVWKAWTTPEHLRQWWCPKPWTTEIRGFDLRPGGAFDMLMRAPNGEESSNPGAFLEVVSQQRIVFISTLTEGRRPGTPWLALTAFILMEEQGGSTKYTARVLHKDAQDCRKHEETGFYDGWGTCIGQLEELASQLA